VKLFIKRLSNSAKLPSYAHPGDAGLDLYAAVSVSIEPGESGLVGTGISIELPPNTEAQVRPRSGLAFKHGVTVLNAPGTIDADYRGEVQVLLVNLGDETFTVTRGLRIAQLVVTPVLRVALVEADALDATPRAAGGFGSTGTGTREEP